MTKGIEKILEDLNTNMKGGEDSKKSINFTEFLNLSAKEPQKYLRNIFQLFSGMLDEYMIKGEDEYANDPQSIDYAPYDCSNLFEKGMDNPFFVDRLFANKLNLFGKNIQTNGQRQNKIYNFVGPHGSGKSLFLDNLIQKFEEYTKSSNGTTYETVWRFSGQNTIGFNSSGIETPYKEFPCPHHDHPIIQIPKKYRKDLIDKVLKESEFKTKLFDSPEFQWIFQDDPCTICQTIYEKINDSNNNKSDPIDVLNLIYPKKRQFNRRTGDGVIIFGQGDSVQRMPNSNAEFQKYLSGIFKDSSIEYIFSKYAKTNNGIYVLMDLKGNNRERMMNLHGIVSEASYKVGGKIEESIKSLFLTVSNPDDLDLFLEKSASFKDRSEKLSIQYILDYNTEIKVLKNHYSKNIESKFFPGVLENFAKIIISTRLHGESTAIKNWIKINDYDFLDNSGALLKMDIYAGRIPEWLNEKDRLSLDKKTRRNILSESNYEGDIGISDRQSTVLLENFMAKYSSKDKRIKINDLEEYFTENHSKFLENNYFNNHLQQKPKFTNFLESMVSAYNINVLNQVRESVWEYNKDRVSKDVQNYLLAVNFDINAVIKKSDSPTGERIKVTEEYLEEMEKNLLGTDAKNPKFRMEFRDKTRKTFASDTLTTEMDLNNKKIHETNQYKKLFKKYNVNARDGALELIVYNKNFRMAIEDQENASKLKKYEKPIRDKVSLLTKNLESKFGYTKKDAKEITLYVIDNYNKIASL